MAGTILDDILGVAADRAADAESRLPELMEGARRQPPARGFARAIARSGLSVIAEIKRRSPSAGVISEALDPVSRAVAYEAGGADAISVLTEPEFFGGSLEDLEAVRGAVAVPVLRKDFTVSPAQIWEARAAGSDAVLLIVAALDDETLASLVAVAREVGVDAIVEAHTIEEVRRAVDARAAIIGVNNRDLATFETDLSVAEGAAGAIPAGVITIGESGVSSVEGASRMHRAGYDAILVGEALVRHEDPEVFVAALRAAR
ncbi:MAG: indole-3-glycerol phosphate synthase TrpC [Acidimicrobiia bacterium]